MNAPCGILFNQESPRRGKIFAARRITRAVARVRLELQLNLCFPDVNALRDWVFADNCVDAKWQMRQQPEPGQCVLATGKEISAQDFCALAFGHVGLNNCGFVEVDPRHFGPAGVDQPLRDTSKARRVLDGVPTVDVQARTSMLEDDDRERAQREWVLRNAGRLLPEGIGHDQ